jgi:hypothetical protein
MASDADAELEALVVPALNSPNHFLDGATERSQTHCGLVGAIAVRAGAVDDEQGVVRILSEVALVDLSMWKVGGSWNVTGGEQLRTAHVEHDKAGVWLRHRLVYVPAVSFEAEESLEMGKGNCT